MRPMNSAEVRKIKVSANRLAWRPGSCTRGFLSTIRLLDEGEAFIAQPMLI